VETPLDPGDIVARIRACGAETVAIVLLNASVNPTHERALRDAIVDALPDIPVCISSEISPEIREYERTSTTVLNSLLMPVVQSYLAKLATRMAERGLSARLLLVQSNGGVCSAEVAAAQPVRLLLSGPSGGALAARRAAERLGRPNLVGIDMGGTSFDVCVVRDHQVALMTQGEIDGLPVRLPMVEIRTIGAGGGSIASVDAGGRLSVGPRSAGARPGPVCYGRGGTRPTVTDANLALGRLDGAFFLGGAMALDTPGAGRAIATQVAEPLGLTMEQAALGILTVVNVGLAAAIRLSLFEKGLDPRDFALLSFGGAGGLHAIPVAEELGISEVVFPPDASTFSAFGILHSDIVHDLAKSRIMRAEPASLPDITAACAELRRSGAALLTNDGVPPDRWAMNVLADMRYRGQAFELVIPWGDVGPTEATLATLIAHFHTLHRQRFSYANETDAVEIVTLRLAAAGRLPRPDTAGPAAPAGGEPMPTRRVFISDAWTDVAIHRRPALAAAIQGPALIEEDYTTIYISPGWRCGPDSHGDLLARKDPA
jgi:N-methylhydantoinase A